MANPERMPTYFIPHGGGPCFFIKPQDMPQGMPHTIWDPLAQYLRGMDAAVGRRPRAVLVVTAHWLTPSGGLHEAIVQIQVWKSYRPSILRL